MGYRYVKLDEAARGLVLALMRYRDGATVDQLAADEYEGESVPMSTADELAELDYIRRYQLDGREVLELDDRGWRWLLETARQKPTPADLSDADPSELIAWGVLGDFLRFAEDRGDTIADLFPVDRLKPLR